MKKKFLVPVIAGAILSLSGAHAVLVAASLTGNTWPGTSSSTGNTWPGTV